MRIPILILGALLVHAASAHRHEVHTHALPLVLSADAVQQGFVRITNLSGIAGTVQIHATDDAGERFGPVELSIGPSVSRHFNSRDLEAGNVAKGLSGGVGDGDGHWWLELHTTLEIQPLAYVRTPDGFLTSMHDVASNRRADFPYTDSTQLHQVAFFNPASNQNQRSMLRLVNPGEGIATIEIAGIDDAGRHGRSEHSMFLPPGALMLSAQQLEATFGDGTGKWHLSIQSTFADIWVMSLLQSPTGHLSNLSTQVVALSVPEPAGSGPPPKPEHFRLTNVFTSDRIILEWWPYNSAYSDHALTHVYRGTSKDIEEATKVATTDNDSWGEKYPRFTGTSARTYAYWIRWENRSGQLGPPSDFQSIVVWPCITPLIC